MKLRGHVTRSAFYWPGWIVNRVQADDKLPEPGKKRESFNTRRNARDISARSEWPGLQRRSDGGGTAQQDLSCDAGRATLILSWIP